MKTLAISSLCNGTLWVIGMTLYFLTGNSDWPGILGFVIFAAFACIWFMEADGPASFGGEFENMLSLAFVPFGLGLIIPVIFKTNYFHMSDSYTIYKWVIVIPFILSISVLLTKAVEPRWARLLCGLPCGVGTVLYWLLNTKGVGEKERATKRREMVEQEISEVKSAIDTLMLQKEKLDGEILEDRTYLESYAEWEKAFTKATEDSRAASKHIDDIAKRGYGHEFQAFSAMAGLWAILTCPKRPERPERMSPSFDSPSRGLDELKKKEEASAALGLRIASEEALVSKLRSSLENNRA